MLSHDATARKWQSQGFSAEQAAQLAAELGRPPIETIKALKKHFGVGIGESKVLADRTLDEPTRMANDYLRLQSLLVAKMPASHSVRGSMVNACYLEYCEFADR